MTPLVDSPISHWRCGVVGLLILGLLLLGATAAHSAVSAAADDPGIAAAARQVAPGGTLRISSLFLETAGMSTLDLQRFEVFTSDAVILAGGRKMEIPDTAYFRGSMVDWPGSRAVLGFKTGGGVEGWISVGDEVWRVSRDPLIPSLRTQRLEPLKSTARPFACQTDELPQNELSWDSLESDHPPEDQLNAGSYSYSARVAIDTDWEFLQRFGGSVTTGTDYVADLVAYASAIYEAEVDTSLVISLLKWWPGPNTHADPWTKSNCLEALAEFRSVWLNRITSNDFDLGNTGFWKNVDYIDETRSIAHFLSGKNTGCGIAYLGVLCNKTYGFGVTGSLSGRFDPEVPLNASAFWDILAVSHEISHNFSSPHTHCYRGVFGNPDPVDECSSTSRPEPQGQCYYGATSAPSCLGAPRCGTIMSYCHLLDGGYGNIALTFGAGHDGGNEPERVPALMKSHVSGQAASYPACLSPVVSPASENSP